MGCSSLSVQPTNHTKTHLSRLRPLLLSGLEYHSPLLKASHICLATNILLPGIANKNDRRRRLNRLLQIITGHSIAYFESSLGTASAKQRQLSEDIGTSRVNPESLVTTPSAAPTKVTPISRYFVAKVSLRGAQESEPPPLQLASTEPAK